MTNIVGRIFGLISVIGIIALALSCANSEIDYVAQGDIYYEQGQVTEAIIAYTTAIQFDPNNAEAYDKRGYVYAKQG